MSDQSDNKDVIINKTLRVLIQQNDLSPEEVAQLRLSHLHLAGKNPSISFMPEGFQEPKVVTLDMETHRALVGWLVNRPDSTSDFLFPGSGSEAMSPDAIRQAVEQAETLSPSPATGFEPPKPAMPSEAGASGSVEPPASNSRPVRPLSRPEIGAPPPGVGPAGASFIPPPTAPEEDETVTIPPPTAASPSPSTRPPTSPPPARPASPPRSPSGPISRPESAPSASAVPSPAKTEAAAAKPDPEATLIGAKKPEIKAKEEKAAISPSSEKPQEKPVPASAKKESRVEPPLAAKKAEKPLAQQAMQRRSGRSLLIPGIIGLVVVCAVCLGGGWLIGQTESGSQFLASLGLPLTATQETPTGLVEETSEAVVFESALPTATLPPTATSTSLPATNTPPPTDTATPTEIPTLAVTDTPTPTETLEPTDTPEAEETSPPPSATSTPGLKYPALELMEPKDGFGFIRGNTVVLRWNPVDLAPDEQYAVRLVYLYQGQPTYQGANIKEPNWTLPLSLFGLVDGPENKYEWFVVVERLNDDGSGTAISPESQHRTFTWK